jgi:hypothetical protein
VAPCRESKSSKSVARSRWITRLLWPKFSSSKEWYAAEDFPCITCSRLQPATVDRKVKWSQRGASETGIFQKANVM